jgi:5-methylcytosine-specific restriction endonuclease McrA
VSVPTRCLDCGDLCQPTRDHRGRCGRCYRNGQRLRNALRTHYAGDWPTIRRALVAAHPWCEECHTTADLTVDHIVPVARGGTNARHNLQVLCRDCNSRKGTT